MGTFPENCFPVIFGKNLEFLCKMQRHSFYQKRCEIEHFRPNFRPPWAYTVIWHFLPKIIVPPFLACILNFCVKIKSEFISEMVQDRQKFRPTGYVEKFSATFCNKPIFLPFLAAILNFCAKQSIYQKWWKIW